MRYAPGDIRNASQGAGYVVYPSSNSSARGKRFSRLIDRLYDAVIDDQLWSGIAADIATAFQSSSVVLKAHLEPGPIQLVDTTSNLVVAPKDQPWADYWHHHDLWVERSKDVGVGIVGTGLQLVPAAEFERTGYFQDWCRKLDIYHMIGALIPLADGSLGVLGIHRLREAGEYTESDRRRVERFLPHLQRALAMRQRLRAHTLERKLSAAALECSNAAVLLVNADCRLLYANPRAQKLLRSEKAFICNDGRLRLKSSADAEWCRAIHRATTVEPSADVEACRIGGALSVQRPDRAALVLLVTPFRRSAQPAEGGSALVLIRDPAGDPPDADLFGSLYGLTPTEARLAVALAVGRSTGQIQSDYGISANTARTHLKRIFSKTGVHRQAELTALVWRTAT